MKSTILLLITALALVSGTSASTDSSRQANVHLENKRRLMKTDKNFKLDKRLSKRGGYGGYGGYGGGGDYDQGGYGYKRRQYIDSNGKVHFDDPVDKRKDVEVDMNIEFLPENYLYKRERSNDGEYRDTDGGDGDHYIGCKRRDRMDKEMDANVGDDDDESLYKRC